ncbi:dihydrodipicolinate synthase family protein [Actinotignum urinale]|uniref:Dihydrodipicolinate synthase family protein n=1 Tax=Actinotignum urinale TaxID=190146 RepID=A0AAW9HVP8_9ACTO|nr:dihydrodipicolinate synthase family protein [Actinotignum urinale]MDY5155138.1 dihydrodipicolinate synthase family protein [Actinotignum urinale]
MADTRFRGVFPPTVTPLTEDCELDVASFERSLNRMIDAGVHGLFVLGSTSEVVFSTDQRRREILETVVRVVDGRVPVLAGVIDMQTERMIEHAKVAQSIGVDGIVATAPFYAIAGTAEIEANFRYIHDAVDLPLFAYDIPVCVHKKLPGDLLLKLGMEGVLTGVKDSSGDDVGFRFLLEMNHKEGNPLNILTGHEVVVDGAYLGGADGAVPGLANVYPDPYVQQWDAAQAGDWGKVASIQNYLADLMRITVVPKGVVGFGAGVGAFKTAMKELGIISTNQMPRPVARLEGDNIKAIRQVLAESNLLS